MLSFAKSVDLQALRKYVHLYISTDEIFFSYSPFLGEGLATQQSRRFYFSRAHCLSHLKYKLLRKNKLFPPPPHFALRLSRWNSFFCFSAVLRINCYKTLGSAGDRKFLSFYFTGKNVIMTFQKRLFLFHFTFLNGGQAAKKKDDFPSL